MPKESMQPTPAELGILNVLWDRGPSTVREIFAALADRGLPRSLRPGRPGGGAGDTPVRRADGHRLVATGDPHPGGVAAPAQRPARRTHPA